MSRLESLVNSFRNAIDEAKGAGEFSCDTTFSRFPHGCCGDASDLLAQYLVDNRIQTWYVSGTHYPQEGTEEQRWEGIQSHAWLTTKDPRITERYQVIDISGDQFRNDPEYGHYDASTYVGPMDAFHRLFEVENRDVYENRGIDTLGGTAIDRLWRLYRIITQRL